MPGPSSSEKIAPPRRELSATQKEKGERKNLVPLDLPFRPLDWKDWNRRRSIRLQNIAETSFKTYSRKEHLTSIDFDEYNVPDLDNVFQSLDWNQDQIEAEHVDMAELLDEVVEDQQVHVEVPIPDGNWRGQVRSDGRVFYIGNETNSLDETSVQISEETDTSIEILGENDSNPIEVKKNDEESFTEPPEKISIFLRPEMELIHPKPTIVEENFREYELPFGWIKRAFKRTTGINAGYWDIFIFNPKGRRFNTDKTIEKFVEKHPEMQYDARLTKIFKPPDLIKLMPSRIKRKENEENRRCHVCHQSYPEQKAFSQWAKN